MLCFKNKEVKIFLTFRMICDFVPSLLFWQSCAFTRSISNISSLLESNLIPICCPPCCYLFHENPSSLFLHLLVCGNPIHFFMLPGMSTVVIDKYRIIQRMFHQVLQHNWIAIPLLVITNEFLDNQYVCGTIGSGIPNSCIAYFFWSSMFVFDTRGISKTITAFNFLI